jgi:hypothetical protein
MPASPAPQPLTGKSFEDISYLSDPRICRATTFLVYIAGTADPHVAGSPWTEDGSRVGYVLRSTGRALPHRSATPKANLRASTSGVRRSTRPCPHRQAQTNDRDERAHYARDLVRAVQADHNERHAQRARQYPCGDQHPSSRSHTRDHARTPPSSTRQTRHLWRRSYVLANFCQLPLRPEEVANLREPGPPSSADQTSADQDQRRVGS